MISKIHVKGNHSILNFNTKSKTGHICYDYTVIVIYFDCYVKWHLVLSLVTCMTWKGPNPEDEVSQFEACRDVIP
jgi:hypothetical protein